MTRQCCFWYAETKTECGRPARGYVCGPRCDKHSPATLAGRTVPVPDPQWTAEAFRRRAKDLRLTGGLTLPEVCPHDEPKGPRYCALCKAEAKEGRWREKR